MGVWGSMKAGYREAMTGELDVEYRRQEDERRAYTEQRIRDFKARAEQRQAKAGVRAEQRAAARQAVDAASASDTPGVYDRMTIGLWALLGFVLTLLSWRALGAWALLVFAGCMFVGLVQHGVRVRRGMERQQLLADPDRSVERADPAA